MVVAALVGALGCGSESGGGGGGADGGGGGNVDGGGTQPDAASSDAAPPAAVRFVTIGDTGEGSQTQRDVAIQIRDKCAADGCDFVIMLGDNFYEGGVDSVTDPQWQTKFEIPYADIDLPFYAVLGNHDYGGKLLGVTSGGLGNEWDKGLNEVNYTGPNTKWVMPATHYTMKHGNVGFIMLDTNSILWGNTEHGDQRAWYPSALAEVAGSEWVIVAAHHPYRSNGTHGNAGSYESYEVGGIEIPIPFDTLNGQKVKEFFDELVCGTADITLSGHDHNRQWLNEPTALCGAELFVSGAGAKVKDFASTGNAMRWSDDTTPGFFYYEIVGKTMTVTAINKDGTVEYQDTITR